MFEQFYDKIIGEFKEKVRKHYNLFDLLNENKEDIPSDWQTAYKFWFNSLPQQHKELINFLISTAFLDGIKEASVQLPKIAAEFLLKESEKDNAPTAQVD